MTANDYKKLRELDAIINGMEDELGAAVAQLLATYKPVAVLSLAPDLDAMVTDAAERLENRLEPAARRRQLLDLIATAGLALALDEVERGEETIEREATKYFARTMARRRARR